MARKGYYDKVTKKYGDQYTEFVGEKKGISDIRNGYEVQPYEYTERDRVTVRMPEKSRITRWPDTRAGVNWSAMGEQDPERALDYARLITRAAKYAQAKQAEFDKNEQALRDRDLALAVGGTLKREFATPQEALRYHVTGAIERGEATAIEEVKG